MPTETILTADPVPPVIAALRQGCAAIAATFGAPIRPGESVGNAIASVIQAKCEAQARNGEMALRGDLGDFYRRLYQRRYEEFCALSLEEIDRQIAFQRALFDRREAGEWYVRPSRKRLALLTEYALILKSREAAQAA